MAYKIRKLPQKEKKENENKDDKLSVNRMEEGEKDGPVSVNRALDEERAEKNQTAGKTVSVADASLMDAVEMPSVKNETVENQEEIKNATEEGFNLNESDDSTTVAEDNGNFLLETLLEENDKRQTISKGKNLPPAKELRDTEKDASPIEEDDLGLPEDSYLIKRKVSIKDLMLQNETQVKQFLGANVRKVRDFISIFDKGFSSKSNPKIDLNYEISQNPVLRKELIAQQLLRNYKSENEFEQRNTRQIFKELNLMEAEGFKDKIEEDEPIHHDLSLLAQIVEKLPGI